MAGSVELEIFSNGQSIDYDPWTKGIQAGKILCTTFELLGSTGTHPKTGKPQGTRDYGAGIKVTKRLDSTSPTLLELFAKSMALKCVFSFRLPDTSGKAQANDAALTITIGKGDKDCSWLRSYQLKAPDTDVAAANAPQEPYEELIFTFTTIEYHRSGDDNQGNPVTKITTDDLAQFGA